MAKYRFEYETGAALYLTIRRNADELWRDNAAGTFGAFVAGSWAAYALALAESPAGGGQYVVEFPEAAGEYWVSVYQQAGAGPDRAADAPSIASDPAYAPADPILAAIEGIDVGEGGGAAGTGADPVTLTITNTASGLPVADADVWVTSDAAGTSVVAGTLQTDSQGRVTFLLDDGVTYYMWSQKDGVNPIRGQSFVAEAD